MSFPFVSVSTLMERESAGLKSVNHQSLSGCIKFSVN